MKKLTLIVFGLSVFLTTKSQENRAYQSFENLSEIVILDIYNISVKYDTSITEIFAKQYRDLDENFRNKFFPDYACEDNTWILLKTKLNRNIDKYYYVAFGDCPSPEFLFYEEGNNMPIQSIGALSLVVSGNGVIYTSEDLGNFNHRRKFEYINGKFLEVEQPYYYVGLKSKTLNTINIYQTKDCKKLIATLPKDYEIEVLLTDEFNSPAFYLVRTSFGLVGWAKLKSGQGYSIDVEGLFYKGD